MGHLLDDIGPIVLMLDGDSANLTSDKGVASDWLAGVPVQGYSSILFIVTLLVGTSSDGNEAGAATVQFQYSSTGSASDAATSNAGMSCTDAIISFDTDSAVNTVATLEFDLGTPNHAGILDSAGKIFGTFDVDSVAKLEILAIPRLGTATAPIAQTLAAVVANH